MQNRFQKKITHISIAFGIFLPPFFIVLASVDGILLSRTVDPSELLMDLGFGGQEQSYIAKIPIRFFGESAVSNLK